MSETRDRDEASPIVAEAEAGRDVLENCLLELGALPADVERAPIAQALDVALGALATLGRSPLTDPAHLELLTRTIDRVRATAAVLSATAAASPLGRRLRLRVESVAARLAAARSSVIDAIVLAQDGTTPNRPAAEPSQPSLRASVGVPALHRLPLLAVPRGLGVVPIKAELEIEPDPDDDIDVLRAHYERLARAGSDSMPSAKGGEASTRSSAQPPSAAPAPAAERHAESPPTDAERAAARREASAEGELEQLRRQLRSFAETIGVLGNLRRVAGELRWHERLAVIEQRLLDHLDALVALGHGPALRPSFDLVAELLRHTVDPHGNDFVRAFARSFVLGCIEGSDTARVAVLGLAHAGTGALDAHREALALGSNTAIDATLRRLVTLPSPTLQEMALDLMVARRSVHVGVVLPLLEHPDDRLRRAALRCLGGVRERELAREQLEIALAHEFDDEVAVDAIRSMLLCDPAVGLAALRARLTLEAEEPGALAPRARSELVVLLALAGAARDAELLETVAHDDPADFEALGWYGDSRCAARLLAELDGASVTASTSDGPPDGPGHRTTSAPAAAVAGVPRNKRGRAAARALARLFGLPPGASDEGDCYEPTTSSARWHRWLAERHDGPAWPTRLRFGEPFRLHQSVEELARVDVPGAVRSTLALEIAIATGAAPVGVDGWVLRQRQEIAEIRAWLAAASDPSGTIAPSPPRRGALVPGRWIGDALRAAAT